MIARLWHGWASAANADAYQTFLCATFLPAINRIVGYQGARVLRRVDGDKVEFLTITYFESLDAIRAFSGQDYETANVAPEARRLLARFDQRCAHYHVVDGSSETSAAASRVARPD